MAAAHITGFLILCRPQNRLAVSAAVAALPGVEVQHCGDDGKIAAVAESGGEEEISGAIMQLQSLPGVIAANLVYHGIDEDGEA